MFLINLIIISISLDLSCENFNNIICDILYWFIVFLYFNGIKMNYYLNIILWKSEKCMKVIVRVNLSIMYNKKLFSLS